jgi:RHS repeat-associated protein
VETRTKGNDGSPGQLIRYQFGNHLGSASLELDGQAQVISYEEYHPYGSTSYQAVNKVIKAAAKRYRYTAKERDEETGFGNHGARYYATWLGRWTSCDPSGIKHGTCLYFFSYGNPIAYIDLNGKAPQASPIADPLPSVPKGFPANDNAIPRPGALEPPPAYEAPPIRPTLIGGALGWLLIVGVFASAYLTVHTEEKTYWDPSIPRSVPPERKIYSRIDDELVTSDLRDTPPTAVKVPKKTEIQKTPDYTVYQVGPESETLVPNVRVESLRDQTPGKSSGGGGGYVGPATERAQGVVSPNASKESKESLRKKEIAKLQALTEAVAEELGKDPGLALLVVSEAEIQSALNNKGYRGGWYTIFGHAVERLVARRVAADPMLSRNWEYIPNPLQPKQVDDSIDFRGKRNAAGAMVDITTPGQVRRKEAQGKVRDWVTYQPPPPP